MKVGKESEHYRDYSRHRSRQTYKLENDVPEKSDEMFVPIQIAKPHRVQDV